MYVVTNVSELQKKRKRVQNMSSDEEENGTAKYCTDNMHPNTVHKISVDVHVYVHAHYCNHYYVHAFDITTSNCKFANGLTSKAVFSAD